MNLTQLEIDELTVVAPDPAVGVPAFTATKPYAIYNHVYGEVADPTEAPHAINFKTGLEIRLHPNRIFTKGELTECIWCATAVPNVQGSLDYSDFIVRETWTYARDILGLAVSRTHVIAWYDVDGAIGEHPKTRIKHYTTLAEKRSESERKRRNQINKATEIAIGVQVQMGTPTADAVQNGVAYWQTLVSEVALYESGNIQPLVNRITNDQSPAWIGAARPLILAEIT